MTTDLRPFTPCTKEQLRALRAQSANQRRALIWLASLFLELLAGTLLLSALNNGWLLGAALAVSWLLGITLHAVVLDALLHHTLG